MKEILHKVEHTREVRCLGQAFAIKDGERRSPGAAVDRIRREQERLVYERGSLDGNAICRHGANL